MDHSLRDTTISIADLYYAGLLLTLAFSEHPGVIGFDVNVK
jgi:UDP-N-acetyl-D-mannosaminuronate dehydrogenase